MFVDQNKRFFSLSHNKPEFFAQTSTIFLYIKKSSKKNFERNAQNLVKDSFRLQLKIWSGILQQKVF